MSPPCRPGDSGAAGELGTGRGQRCRGGTRDPEGTAGPRGAGDREGPYVIRCTMLKHPVHSLTPLLCIGMHPVNFL